MKSIREGKANLKDAYGLLKDGECFLLNAHIGPFSHGNAMNHEELRTRKLLLHRQEIAQLTAATKQKGYTLIPVRLYFRNGRVKCEIALAKGKMEYDKRATKRKREADGEAKAAIARQPASLTRRMPYVQSGHVRIASMDTKVVFQDAATFATPLLAVFVVDLAVGKDADPIPVLLTTSDAVTNAADSFVRSGEFKATLCETMLLHAPQGLKAERLLLIGLGKVKTFSIDEVRKGAGAAVRAAKPRGIRGACDRVPGGSSTLRRAPGESAVRTDGTRPG